MTILTKIRIALFQTFFPTEAGYIRQLILDNEELQGIAVEQIKHIQELEDKNAHLDFKLEDTEVVLEYTKGKLSEAEDEIGELESKISVLEYKLQSGAEF